MSASPVPRIRAALRLLVALALSLATGAAAQDLSARSLTIADGGTINGVGRLHVAGGERLYLLNQGGVFVSRAWGGSGSLTVEGAIVGNSLTSWQRMHISGDQDLYLLNRGGVFVSKAWGGNGNLTVDGVVRSADVRAGRIEVRSDWWADDVFAADYRLRSLDEVRTHIDEHGHLPDVPSAAQLARQGLDVHAMLATQMRKIEELTLYAMKQQEELDELRAAVRALRPAP